VIEKSFEDASEIKKENSIRQYEEFCENSTKGFSKHLIDGQQVQRHNLSERLSIQLALCNLHIDILECKRDFEDFIFRDMLDPDFLEIFKLVPPAGKNRIQEMFKNGYFSINGKQFKDTPHTLILSVQNERKLEFWADSPGCLRVRYCKFDSSDEIMKNGKGLNVHYKGPTPRAEG